MRDALDCLGGQTETSDVPMQVGTTVHGRAKLVHVKTGRNGQSLVNGRVNTAHMYLSDYLPERRAFMSVMNDRIGGTPKHPMYLCRSARPYTAARSSCR